MERQCRAEQDRWRIWDCVFFGLYKAGIIFAGSSICSSSAKSESMEYASCGSMVAVGVAGVLLFGACSLFGEGIVTGVAGLCAGFLV